MFDFNIIKPDKVFIIAEAGVNHNGSIQIAKNMVDAAVESGADAIKFQTFKADKLVTRKAQKAEYQKQNTHSSESQYEMLRKLELTYEDHRELFQYCKQKEIIFLSTPFDVESVDLLDKLGVEMYKISSGDLTNKPMLQYTAEKGKPIILSTGMSTLGEVEEAVGWLKDAGNDHIILLHCTTNYPTLYGEVNLKAMKTLEQAFKLPVGYSDHTAGIEIPIAAVAMGACVIEKHFTLDKKMNGPDHKASLEPEELKKMVECIRNVENALGNGIKRASNSEFANTRIARKSVVAAKKISKGQIIKEEDLTVKRPEEGVQPKFFYYLVGRTAKYDIDPDEPITWEKIAMGVQEHL